MTTGKQLEAIVDDRNDYWDEGETHFGLLEEMVPVRSRPPNLRYSVTRSVVGPRHDPYGRIVYRVGQVELTDCAFAGTTLRVHGHDVIVNAEMNSDDDLRASTMFEQWAGCSTYELQAWDAIDFDDERVSERT